MAIYFARAEGTDLVKIGYAVNASTRLRYLQAGCPHTLRLVRVEEGGRQTEAALRRRYKAQQIEREWFSWSDDMMSVSVPSHLPDLHVSLNPSIPLHRAARIIGSTNRLAKAINRTQSTVWGWMKRGWPPPEACPAIERATGGEVTAVDLLAPAMAPKPKRKRKAA